MPANNPRRGERLDPAKRSPFRGSTRIQGPESLEIVGAAATTAEIVTRVSLTGATDIAWL